MAYHTPITAQPTTLDSIKRVVAAMPGLQQVELMRFINDLHSGSYGSDRVARGCDEIEDDIREEQRVVETGRVTPIDPYDRYFTDGSVSLLDLTVQTLRDGYRVVA